MGYPTTEDLVGASTVAALTEADEAEQDRLRRSSIAAVEDFCRQSFDNWEGAKVVEGSGERQLFLPRRLSSLTALVVARTSLVAADVTLTEDHDALELLPTAGLGANYYERASRAADAQLGYDVDRQFTFGYGTVTITGIWGWDDDEFPDLVFDAIRTDMEDTALVDGNKLTPTIRQYRHMGVRDISQGNMRAAISGAPGLSADAQQLLAGLIWEGPLGALA